MAKTLRKTDAFIVIDNGLRILITPSDGWYAVQGLDIRGLNTQGRTIEEAICMAHDAAKALADARETMAKGIAKEMKAGKKPAPKKIAARARTTASRSKRKTGRSHSVAVK